MSGVSSRMRERLGAALGRDDVAAHRVRAARSARRCCGSRRRRSAPSRRPRNPCRSPRRCGPERRRPSGGVVARASGSSAGRAGAASVRPVVPPIGHDRLAARPRSRSRRARCRQAREARRRRVAARCSVTRAAGRRVNVLPSPGSLASVISPPRRLDEVAADREPEPGSTVSAGRRAVGLGERLEHRGLQLLLDADAGVGDADRDHRIAPVSRSRPDPSRRAELHRTATLPST